MRLRHSRHSTYTLGQRPRWAITYTLFFSALLLLFVVSPSPTSSLVAAFTKNVANAAARPTSTPMPIAGETIIVSPTPDGIRGEMPQLPSYKVVGTGTEGLVLRAAPDQASGQLANLLEGTHVYQTGPAVAASERFWVPITTAEHQEGWVASDYLRRVR